MRLHYLSFFYYNIILLLFFILNLDILFLFFFFIRKIYCIYKESLMEYYFQEFDGLTEEGQFIDLYENKLYADFDFDEGIEGIYLYNLFLEYALREVNFDFEAFNGSFTLKWNDSNIEELNHNRDKTFNFKKVYIKSYNDDHFYKNMINKDIDNSIKDEDYYNIYNYKNMLKCDIEDPLFVFENEKFYYSHLKLFFLKENFYDIYINDNYHRFLNYNNFINNLKKRVLLNKYNNIEKKNINYNKNNFLLINLDDNLLQIRKEYLHSISFEKK